MYPIIPTTSRTDNQSPILPSILYKDILELINDVGVASVKLKIGSGLLPIIILSGVLVLVIHFIPNNVVRIILGLPFILLFPGYSLTAAISPRNTGMGGVLRLALSIGLSVAVVTLTGFILNYTPIGITLWSMLIITFIFIVIMSIIGWLRMWKLTMAERLDIDFKITTPNLGTGVDKALHIFLIVAVLGALASIGYAIAKPKPGDNFTEFYLLGLNAQATGYVKDVILGDPQDVIVGIKNNEHKTVTYRVVVTIGGINNNEVDDITLTQGTKWEKKVTFTPQNVGDNQKVEFSLYRGNEAASLFEPLHLWVNVTR